MAASKTAEFVAFYRALETEETSREPLFRDPFARQLLPRPLELAVRAARFEPLRKLLFRYADWRAPGARTSAIGRTRFIDDTVRAAVADGAVQLVILGTGYDCRAHRLAELSKVRVFEVDQKDTLAERRSRVSRGALALRKDAVSVAVDFVRERLSERLTASGFDPSQRTVFVWEGVTNYLSASAVADVLSFVATCARGSTLVFTYIHRAVLDGTVQFEGAAKLMQGVARLGEPWRFGLLPDELKDYLSGFGLSLISDLGADEYRQRYLREMGDMRGYRFYRLAVARVGL